MNWFLPTNCVFCILQFYEGYKFKVIVFKNLLCGLKNANIGYLRQAQIVQENKILLFHQTQRLNKFRLKNVQIKKYFMKDGLQKKD